MFGYWVVVLRAENGDERGLYVARQLAASAEEAKAWGERQLSGYTAIDARLSADFGPLP